MPLAPETLAEKLAPPRPLRLVGAGGAALYGPPLAPARRAYLAWLELAPGAHAALDAVIAEARADGAATLQAGGPPGNYVVSGVAADDRAWRDLLEGAGFEARARHVDLAARPPAVPCDPRVARCAPRDADAVLAWIASTFAPAWALEAARALAHGGLFVLREGAALAGFGAHSGNNVAAGTFGPVGVAPGARGGGYGRALALAALGDLAARGFERVTIPWVDPATVPFYEKLCGPVARVERVAYVRALHP